MLKPEHYDTWKDIELKFDPSELLGNKRSPAPMSTLGVSLVQPFCDFSGFLSSLARPDAS